MPNKMIHCEISQEIATVIIDNPPLNLINLFILNELREHLSKLREDKNVWAIILTGAGDRDGLSANE